MTSRHAAQAVFLLSARGNKLQDKAPMNFLRILLRTAKFHPCLRKAEVPRLPGRQGSQAYLAPAAGKAILLLLPDVVLPEEESPDPFIGNTPDFAELQVHHPKSVLIIIENRDFAKRKVLHAFSYHFVLFGTRCCLRGLKKQKHNGRMPPSNFAFVKAVDEPLSGNAIGAVLLRPQVSEGGIFCLEERK